MTAERRFAKWRVIEWAVALICKRLELRPEARHNMPMSAQLASLCKSELVTRRRLFLLAAVSLAIGEPARAGAAPVIDKAIQPTVRCIYGVLKSSSDVQNLSLYSIDSSRFAIEYAFRNKANQIVVSDIEFFADQPFTATDKIPLEVSMETADEARELETKLNLVSRCGFRYSFDNTIPEPSARADWQKIEWPWSQPK